MNTAIVTPAVERTNSQMVFNDVDVTPELAQIWLGLNTANRKLKIAQVQAYAEDMKAGRWVLNGEAIKFAGPAYKPTKLLDGQNRLHAVMKSGVTVRLSVVFDVPDHAQGTMDSGAKRSVSDNLAINGYKNTTVIAAAASLALRVETGRVAQGNVKMTNAAVEEYIAEHPELIQAGEIAQRLCKRSDVPASLIAYTYTVFSKLDKEAAYVFWRDAAEKIGLEAGDPVIALTNLFSDARRDNRRILPHAALSAIYRAWNARRAGEHMSFIRLRSAGQYVAIPPVK